MEFFVLSCLDAYAILGNLCESRCANFFLVYRRPPIIREMLRFQVTRKSQLLGESVS